MIGPELFEACRRSVYVLLPDGRVLNRAPACFAILEHAAFPAPFKGWLLGLGRLGPSLWLLNRLYDFVASHRRFASRIFHRLLWKGRRDADPVPADFVPAIAEIRARRRR